MTDIAAFLAEHWLFGCLDSAARDEAARSATKRHLARGEILAVEGEPCQAIYLVLDGRVRALKTSPAGREQIVHELRSGDAFYLVPSLDGGQLPATTQAATRATVLSWPTPTFLAMLDAHPALARLLLVALSRRLRRLSDLAGELALYSVAERLARLLLEIADAPPEARLTQQEMAGRLGTVREVVARTLADFQARGWLRIDKGRIQILDPVALRSLASR